MILPRALVAPSCRRFLSRRYVSTLSSNPAIKAFPHPAASHEYLLTYLDTNPPSPTLAIGTSSQLPPTPQSFTENHRFVCILYRALREYAADDPYFRAQARALAGPIGAGAGGWIHLSDLRNPPNYGRIASPEDIMGSIEVDRYGKIIGEFIPSLAYRIVTNEGILGLSDFLRTKVVEKLNEAEADDKRIESLAD